MKVEIDLFVLHCLSCMLMFVLSFLVKCVHLKRPCIEFGVVGIDSAIVV